MTALALTLVNDLAEVGRMAEAAKRLRVSLPSPGLARFDPYALRALVLLLLIIAVAAGGGEAEGGGRR